MLWGKLYERDFFFDSEGMRQKKRILIVVKCVSTPLSDNVLDNVRGESLLLCKERPSACVGTIRPANIGNVVTGGSFVDDAYKVSASSRVFVVF